MQVSFSLDVAPGERIHETELVPYVHDLAKSFPLVVGREGSPILPEGPISVVFEGNELLDQEHWVYLFSVSGLVSLICEDAPTESIRLQGSRRYVHLTKVDGELDFEVQSGDEIISRTRLPLEAFIGEWILMKWRERRVRAAFGDFSGQYIVDQRPVGDYCDRLTQLAGIDRLEYTLTHPLEELLLNPIPPPD